MEFTALIVDDEADGRSVLKKLLEKFCPQVNCIGEAGSADAAYDLITSLKPQVVFLDIQMPRANGFELLKKFNAIPFEIVFVTSYDKYAIEAIRFSALDYLLKPVEVVDLEKAIGRLEHALEKKQMLKKQVVNVITHLENKEVEKKIAVHHNDLVTLLPLGEITHFEGDGNYTVLHTLNKEHYHSSKNLQEFEDMLRNYPQFLRIGKACIANINHVTAYSKGEHCMITLANLHTFEVSRRKKQEVLARMKEK
jgi:two-component system LytT family response regulator